MKVFKKFVSLVGLVSWSWRELGQESVLLKVTCTTLFLKLGWVSNFEETNWVTTYLTAPPSSCPGARTLSRHSRGLSSCPLCLRADGRQESHDPVSYLSARRAQRLVWPGWSVPANWVRLEADHSSLQICGPQTCCPGEAAYLCWRQRTSPGDQREFEKSVVRPTERERGSPGRRLPTMPLPGLSWPTFIKLVSDSSPAPASTPTICPQTWLLLLFQAFTTFLYWSQRNFKMNKYELCHIIVLPCGDSFRIIDILVWWISNNSQT